MLVVLASLAVVALFEVTTSMIDVTEFRWDNVRYLAMAESWFAPDTMTAPFAYRWGTPLLARVVADLFGVSLTMGFRVQAWLGAAAQLTCAFWVTRDLFRSLRAGWGAWLLTALSFWNVRFLLFDPFRPDHFAYPVVLLASWAVVRRRWGWVVVLTLAGAPFREFTLLPALAALGMLITTRDWRTVRRWVAPLLVTIGVAVLAPRLIVTTGNASRQTVEVGSVPEDLTHLLLYWGRHLNLVLATVSFVLPLILLGTRARWRSVADQLGRPVWHFLAWYTLGVAALTFMGGTDLPRFVSYLIVPVAVLGGGLIRQVRAGELALVTGGLFWFNRLAEPVPDRSVQEYKDFWAAYSGLVNRATAVRFAWAGVLMAVAAGTRWVMARRSAARRPT